MERGRCAATRVVVSSSCVPSSTSQRSQNYDKKIVFLGVVGAVRFGSPPREGKVETSYLQRGPPSFEFLGGGGAGLGLLVGLGGNFVPSVWAKSQVRQCQNRSCWPPAPFFEAGALLSKPADVRIVFRGSLEPAAEVRIALWVPGSVLKPALV